MISGLVGSLIVFAAGAILDFALTASPYQHGFNVRTVGMILMIVGAVGVIFSLMGMLFAGSWRRHRTIIDDGHGNVVRREDTFV